MSESLLLGVRESARDLGIGRDAVYALIREGRLRSVTIGRKRLVPRVELEAFIARESTGGAPP